MVNKKITFEDFIATVDADNRDFVIKLHEYFMNNDCKIEVKESKRGYLVSYIIDKKTVINYVFRNAGLIMRIYANHVHEYQEFLETLPADIIKKIKAAPICKGLIDPSDCNSKCPRGYDFILQGEHLQKCRSNAFMFVVCADNNGFIKEFLLQELAARKKYLKQCSVGLQSAALE